MFVVDYVQNNRGHGPFGEYIDGIRFEPGLARPFFDNMTLNKSGSARYGRDRFVVVNDGREYNEKEGVWVPKEITLTVAEAEKRYDCEVPISNAMTLPKDTWIDIDRRVVKANRARLKFAADIAAASSRTIDGMANPTVEYQAMTDMGEAIQDMDGVSDTRADMPNFNLRSMPLPVTHSGANFTQRQIAASQKGGRGLDLIAIEAGGFRVGEMIEKVTLGVETGMTFGPNSTSDTRYSGSSTVYGATNFPYRVAKTDLHTPTAATPENILEDVIEMIEVMIANGFYGPFVLYTSTGYSRWLRDDYFRAGSTAVSRSMRSRLLELEDLVDIRRLDYLTTGYQLLLVQLDAMTVEMIEGMAVTTIQWPSKGGLKQNLEVMAIQAVIWKTPYNGIAGIVHGTTS